MKSAAGVLRILISGCPMAVPNWKLLIIVENVGAVIAGEESCVDERGTGNLVGENIHLGLCRLVCEKT